MVLLVRTERPAPDLPAALRTRVAAIDPSVPLYQVAPLTQAMERYFLQRRFQTLLLAGFSSVALILAAVGVYGLIQYSVAQRTREIGVRIALGAVSRNVTLMVLRQGLSVALPGLVAGIFCALWLSEALAALLFGVVGPEPANVLVAFGVLLLTTLLACWVPARRAARVDPLTALRSR
jgi:ABC-type antimicrobial peptide transport system permease subunit